MRSTTRDTKTLGTTTVAPGAKPASSGTAASATNKLEVTVIPVDDEPYSKTIIIPSSMIGQSSLYASGGVNGSASIHSSTNSANATQYQYPSLKDIFQAKENLWKNIFGNYVSQNKQPLFSIFRKKITIKTDSKIPHPQGEDIGLHILFLKCDGNRFPRNAYANQLEVYCSTYFYGPLVIVYGELSPPYKLHSFSTAYLMDRIQPLNEEEQKIYPLPFSAKKCATVRNLMADTKFSQDLDQYEKSMSLWEFMIYSYKTSFCPFINKKHEWSECNYAHRQQDFRRPPHLYLYYLEKCQHVTDDGTWDECPEYLECQYSHTLVEQLFSPLNYKLRRCSDALPDQKFQCKKRLDLCSHNHSQDEKNLAIKALYNPPDILPEHESMQDYIDMIDNEGLLTGDGADPKDKESNSASGDESENEATEMKKTKSTASISNTIQKPVQIQNSEQFSANEGNNDVIEKITSASAKVPLMKKPIQQQQQLEPLIKMPEDNTDGWKLLEQSMNKQSSQKQEQMRTTQQSNLSASKSAQAISPLPASVVKDPIQLELYSNLANNQDVAKVTIPEFATLDDEDFTIQKKNIVLAKQLQIEKPKEPDYVQEMIKANNPKNSAVFGATGTSSSGTANPKTDIKNTVIKSERKNRKKGKKGVMKVQEVVDMGNHNNQQHSRSNRHNDMNDDNHELQESQQNEKHNIAIEYISNSQHSDRNDSSQQNPYPRNIKINSTKRSTSKFSGQSMDSNGFTGSEQELSQLNSNSNRGFQNEEKSSVNNQSNDQKTNPEVIEHEIDKSDDDYKNTLFSTSPIYNNQAQDNNEQEVTQDINNTDYLSIPSTASQKNHRKTTEESKKVEYDLNNVKAMLEDNIIDLYQKKKSEKSIFPNGAIQQENSNSPQVKQARYVKKGTLHQYQVKQPDLKAQQTIINSSSQNVSSPPKKQKEKDILKMTTKYQNQSRFCELLSSSSSSSSRNHSYSNDHGYVSQQQELKNLQQSVINSNITRNINLLTSNSNQNSHSSHIQNTTGTIHKPQPLKSNLAKQNYNR